MDRQIVYPGSIPLDTDLLGSQRNTMIALGYLAQMVLGTATVVDGLACTPTQPATLAISVGAGSITQFGAIDTTPFGSLPALPSNSLVRIGVNIGANTFSLTPPSASGQVINYLVEASLLEMDADATVLPYYNAAAPGQPFSGPGNDGLAQPTARTQTVQIIVKAGPAVSLGSATLPAVDAGWVGLYAVSVAYGQQTITSANIATIPTAPFLNWKLPKLSPGTHNLAVFQPTTQGVWTVPAGIGVLKLRIWGAGGAGGDGFGSAGGGGAAGGYSEGYYSVVPGQSYQVAVGNGGAGAGSGGGTSSFGSLASASGGSAGGSGGSSGGGVGGAIGGAGFGSGLSLPGAGGGNAVSIGGEWLSGVGGGSYGNAGGASIGGNSALAGLNGTGPGSGGSGGIGAGVGGQGGPGLVLVEW